MLLPPYPVFLALAAPGVLLRQVEASDLADVLDISYYNARPATTLAEAGAMLRQIAADYARGECLHWGIAAPQTNRVVGTVGFYRGLAGGTGELGCVLKPAFRGRGLMQAALRLAIGFGQGPLGLRTIIALTTSENTPAIRLLERLQFQPAGAAGVGNEICCRLR